MLNKSIEKANLHSEKIEREAKTQRNGEKCEKEKSKSDISEPKKEKKESFCEKKLFEKRRFFTVKETFEEKISSGDKTGEIFLVGKKKHKKIERDIMLMETASSSTEISVKR